MAGQFTPPEDAGTAVETGAVTGGSAFGTLTAARAGADDVARTAACAARAIHAGTWSTGRQLQPLARGDHVRVGQLAAVVAHQAGQSAALS